MAEGQTIAILGAGTMGSGIAHVAALSGYRVALHDAAEAALKRAVQQVRSTLDRAVAKQKINASDRDSAWSRVTPQNDLGAAVRGATLVIEAAPESMQLKKDLFARISQAAPKEAILATNTSSLSVTEIASAANGPERVLGMHFFNPPYVLKLLELVIAEQTTDDTVDRAKELGASLGRELVVVHDSPGFATTRLGLVLGLEAMRMVQEGVASAEEIDKAMELGYRHPMGPLKLGDLVGLDVRLAIAEYLHRELGGEQFRPPPILRRMVRAGKLGKKSGQGFYRW